ncbi:hypothetical protein KFK14_19520 [Sphingobium phenoxybenzoativorans]|uniref:Uncharacterized protein n=1 Tax=Sphingobium phenoxybenzoativorans TaxID=1592790 RepID=A0A975K5I0_9SPHN|nr:hypothetical protein [Sphingobium phenoxybenzoativorans]QUT05165.1 hypothetical protein KFK14_19520 [Sphingobium phenoxybenzoativorans]
MQREKSGGKTVTHLSETEARSGSRTRVTRNILIVSLSLVILLLVIAVGTGYFKTSQTGADDVTATNTAQEATN